MSSDNGIRHIGTLDGATMLGFALIGLLVALAISVSCGGGLANGVNNGGGAVAATVSGTISVGTAPSAIAVDSTADKIFVTDFGTQPTFNGYGCSPSGQAIDGATLIHLLHLLDKFIDNSRRVQKGERRLS